MRLGYPAAGGAWNGDKWAAIPARDLHGLAAIAVTASSARDAWLFGVFPDAKAPDGTISGALHWNGTAWTRRAVPDWLIKINGSGDTDLYPADIGRSGTWVFSLGGYIGETAAFAGRYHHGRWTKLRLPGVPDSAAALSVNNVWVLGQELAHLSRFVLMHWNGQRWSTTSLPRQSVAGNAGSLVATGPRDLWMSWFPTKSGAPGYLLHWAGGRWRSHPQGSEPGLLASGPVTETRCQWRPPSVVRYRSTPSEPT
ncbi:MAG: hypothetical protein ACRDRJ_54025 [Streptosporangiaceae bacterium]